MRTFIGLVAFCVIGTIEVGCNPNADVSAESLKQHEDARVKANEEYAKKNGIDMGNQDR